MIINKVRPGLFWQGRARLGMARLVLAGRGEEFFKWRY